MFDGEGRFIIAVLRAHGSAMAAHELGQGVYDDIGAVFNRPHKDRCRHGIVDNQGRTQRVRKPAQASRCHRRCLRDCRPIYKKPPAWFRRSTARCPRPGRSERSAPGRRCPSAGARYKFELVEADTVGQRNDAVVTGFRRLNAEPDLHFIMTPYASTSNFEEKLIRARRWSI